MKERLDVLLVNNGFAESREKAKRTIMAGLVTVDGRLEDKPGSRFDIDADVQVAGKECPYVSRGGLKLEKAINEWGVSCENAVCIVMGASTGGFTDCMLQRGAAKVYSIDVGHGQLDWKLRNDPRVVCMERFNARELSAEDLPQVPDFASIDVSFISLRLILGPVFNTLSPGGSVAALIKPQFEAGREKVGRKGVVRDPAVHEEVINHVLDFAAETGFSCAGLTFSPITGPEGNIEYLAYLVKEPGNTARPDAESIRETVREAHGTLSGSQEHGRK